MPSPNFSVLPVSRSDLSALANLVHTSKLSLTINRLLFKDWPNEAAQKGLYRQAVESAFEDPSVECLKVVDGESGDIVGHLALTRRRPGNTEKPPAKKDGDGNQKIPDGLDPVVFAAVSKAAVEVAKDMSGVDRFGTVYSDLRVGCR